MDYFTGAPYFMIMQILDIADAVEGDEEGSLFAFLELKVNFILKHGNVLYFCANSLHYCTRVLKRQNQLGLAFFQKHPI